MKWTRNFDKEIHTITGTPKIDPQSALLGIVTVHGRSANYYINGRIDRKFNSKDDFSFFIGEDKWNQEPQIKYSDVREAA